MKKLFIGSLMMLTASIAMADTAPVAAKPAGSCKQIVQACTQAGFEKGMHKKDGKGLYKDFLDPILAGQTVAGVTVDPAVVADCNAKKAKRQAKKGGPVVAPTAPAGGAAQ
jgi:hypothetical protein